MQFKITTISIALLLFTSCGNETEIKVDQKKTKTAAKNCNLSMISYESGPNQVALKFQYKRNKLSIIETFENDENVYRTMQFKIHDHGGIQSLLSGTTIAKYVYDDDNKVLVINGEQGISTRHFEYNDKGQIIGQTIMTNGLPELMYSYTYDADSKPVNVSIFNSKNELLEVNVIDYDDKKNPFKNKGVLVNNFEKVLGYPVGNYDHNIISIHKSYKKDLKRFDGSLIKAGQVEFNRIDYKYNALGYPTHIRRSRGGKFVVMELTYDCY